MKNIYFVDINSPVDTRRYGVISETSHSLSFLNDTRDNLLEQLSNEFRDGSRTHGLVNYCSSLIKCHQLPTQDAAIFGSSTGHICFLLSKLFDKVLGIDTCARLVDTSLQLQKNNYLSLEDQDVNDRTFTLDDDVKPDKITFKQLTWIPNEIPVQDLVVLCHLHRVYNPKAWLLRLWEILKPTGLAVIVSQDDQLTKDYLDSILVDRLECVGLDEIVYVTEHGEEAAQVTAWKHR